MGVFTLRANAWRGGRATRSRCRRGGCGSDWDIRRCLLYVRFAPESGHGRMRAQFIRPPRPADSRLFAQKS